MPSRAPPKGCLGAIGHSLEFKNPWFSWRGAMDGGRDHPPSRQALPRNKDREAPGALQITSKHPPSN